MDRLGSEQNLAIRKEIGSILRQQYELPPDLPKHLGALMVELDEQGDDHEEPYWRRYY